MRRAEGGGGYVVKELEGRMGRRRQSKGVRWEIFERERRE
jgi:hypothetical protein